MRSPLGVNFGYQDHSIRLSLYTIIRAAFGGIRAWRVGSIRAAVSRPDKSFIIIAEVQHFLLDTNSAFLGYYSVVPQALDLTGKRFGRLIVVRRAETSSNAHSMWACDCDCGTTNHVVVANVLRKGFSRSCGCLRREFLVE